MKLTKDHIRISSAKTFADLETGAEIVLTPIHGGINVTLIPADPDADDSGFLLVGLHKATGLYSVLESEASSGWGPLLYDIALEYATRHGKGLIADRDNVSSDATAVWDYYLKNRSDVENSPLPPEIPTHDDPSLDRVYRFKKLPGLLEKLPAKG